VWGRCRGASARPRTVGSKLRRRSIQPQTASITCTRNCSYGGTDDQGSTVTVEAADRGRQGLGNWPRNLRSDTEQSDTGRPDAERPIAERPGGAPSKAYPRRPRTRPRGFF
jgi:hypothetical protein